VPDWLSITIAVGGVLIAAAGLVRGEVRANRAQRDERRERSARQKAEAGRDALEATVQAPEVVVEYVGGGVDDYNRPGDVEVYLRLVNLGPTIAKDVCFGIRVDAWQGCATTVDGARVTPAVGVDKTLDGWLLLPQSLNVGEDPQQHITALWAEWHDKRGTAHKAAFEA
jgi:hypothetical protein